MFALKKKKESPPIGFLHKWQQRNAKLVKLPTDMWTTDLTVISISLPTLQRIFVYDSM